MKLMCIVLVFVVFDECGAVSATEKTPGLLTLLNTIKDGGEVSKVLSFLNEMKMARKGLSTIETLSPVMKSIYVKAAKRNPKLKVLLDVMNGHMPDLYDIYKLITAKSDGISAAIAKAQYSNPLFNEMVVLTKNQSGHVTLEGITQLASIFFGRKFEFEEKVFQCVNKGERMNLTIEETAQFNLLQFLFFYVDNYIDVVHTAISVTESDNAYTKILSSLGQLDF